MLLVELSVAASSAVVSCSSVEAPCAILRFCCIPSVHTPRIIYTEETARTLGDTVLLSFSSAFLRALDFAAAGFLVAVLRFYHHCQYIELNTLHTGGFDRSLRTAVPSSAPAARLGAMLYSDVFCGRVPAQSMRG